MIKYKRAQSAIEFFILVFGALFIFLGLLYVVQVNIGDDIRENIDLEIKEVALTVQDEINFAFSSSNGYYREFNVPERISSKEYEINITQGSVYIRTLDERFAMSLPVLNITGDVKKGINKIKKEQERVYLNSP